MPSGPVSIAAPLVKSTNVSRRDRIGSSIQLPGIECDRQIIGENKPLPPAANLEHQSVAGLRACAMRDGTAAFEMFVEEVNRQIVSDRILVEDVLTAKSTVGNEPI